MWTGCILLIVAAVIILFMNSHFPDDPENKERF